MSATEGTRTRANTWTKKCVWCPFHCNPMGFYDHFAVILSILFVAEMLVIEFSIFSGL